MRFIVDASPLLNFLAVGEQNCLLQTATRLRATLCVPEQVGFEIDHQVRQARFARSGAEGRWRTLRSGGRIEVLSDDITANRVLGQELTLVAGVPSAQRIGRARDLGEDMAIAHACTLAWQGHDVIVLIDERRGRAAAATAKKRLELKGAPGSIKLTSTLAILQQAEQAWFGAGRSSWSEVHAAMAVYDDGI